MLNVAIIGGGIGGLCAAMALQQENIAAQVYEAAPELRPVGAGIWVPPNAMLVLDRLGIRKEVENAGVVLEKAQVREKHGRVLQTLPFQEIEAKMGQSNVAIHRGELQQVLAKQLAPETLHLNKRCTEIVEEGAHVSVRFQDETVQKASLVVGADGLHSIVRKHLCGKRDLVYADQTCYRGIADIDLPVDLAKTSWEVWGGKFRFGFSAIGPGKVYWFAPISAGPDTPHAGKTLLEAFYTSFPEPIPSLIAHTDPERIIQTDLFDIAPLKRWWAGRIVLLGDAAHAMLPNLGQGGGQAIEDAWVLAKALPEYNDHHMAFEQYVQKRMRRVHKIMRLSRLVGRMAHMEGSLGRSLRNGMVRSTPQSLRWRQLTDLYRGPV